MKKIAGKVTDIDFFSRKSTLPTCPMKEITFDLVGGMDEIARTKSLLEHLNVGVLKYLGGSWIMDFVGLRKLINLFLFFWLRHQSFVTTAPTPPTGKGGE